VRIVPWHPYTKASARAVVPGTITRYQIEIFPTLATIAKGDRIRVTLSTSDTPHLTPLPAQVATLSGGIYSIRFSNAYPSSLTVDFRRP
jgi:predicted acyl esterase